MNNSSMIYTVGMALDRAQESGAIASILVGGQWLTGTVVLHDGHGVVLDNTLEHVIAKLEHVAAVKVIAPESAHHGRIDQGPGPRDFSEPMPMGSAASWS